MNNRVFRESLQSFAKYVISVRLAIDDLFAHWRIHVKRLALLLITSITITIFCAAKTSQPQTQVDKLKKQRISLLQERVESMKQLTASAQVENTLLVRCEIDLFNAKLEYAETDFEKQNQIKSLIKKYDFLIEISESRLKSGLVQSKSPLADLLFLKSERVRYEILLASSDD